jgi:hypothetical protein
MAFKGFGSLTWQTNTLARFCKKRQDSDLDFTMLISSGGIKGRGKSTYAMQIGRAICPTFKLETHMVSSPKPEAIADCIENAGQSPAIVIDEAIGTMYREKWADKAQQAIHQYLQQYQRRDKNAVIIFCIPNIHDFRRPLLRSSVNLWIEIYTRGKAALMLRSAFPEDDCFRLWEFDKITGMMRRKEGRSKTWQEYEPKFQERVYAKLSTFLAFGRFKQMELGDYTNYLTYSDQFRAEGKTKLFSFNKDNKQGGGDKTQPPPLWTYKPDAPLPEDKKVLGALLSSGIEGDDYKRVLKKMKGLGDADTVGTDGSKQGE